MGEPRVFACACPACGTIVLVSAADIRKPVTARCRCRTRKSTDTPFGRREWDACREPRLLRECLVALEIAPSRRIRRLLPVGIGRLIFDWCRNYWFREAIARGEEFADTPSLPRRKSEIVEGLAPTRYAAWGRGEWRRVGVACVADDPVLEFPGIDQADGLRVCDVYRDLLPNPFTPIIWRPDWLTSTVRDLAAHIYEQRAFDLMPILGDALMDARCDHQLVQDHCRAPKPHSRGCWVVDAILGKS